MTHIWGHVDPLGGPHRPSHSMWEVLWAWCGAPRGVCMGCRPCIPCTWCTPPPLHLAWYAHTLRMVAQDITSICSIPHDIWDLVYTSRPPDHGCHHILHPTHSMVGGVEGAHHHQQQHAGAGGREDTMLPPLVVGSSLLSTCAWCAAPHEGMHTPPPMPPAHAVPPHHLCTGGHHPPLHHYTTTPYTAYHW